MKIGDTVRFLKEVGGGRVSGFQDKNTVLVEDSDGFEIPMPISEVVVERGESYENGTWAKRKEEQKAKTPIRYIIKTRKSRFEFGNVGT